MNLGDVADPTGWAIWEGVQPRPTRHWYSHCYGVKVTVWAVHGYFERVYFLAPDMIENKQMFESFQGLFESIVRVLESEMSAAIDAQPNHPYKGE